MLLAIKLYLWLQLDKTVTVIRVEVSAEMAPSFEAPGIPGATRGGPVRWRRGRYRPIDGVARGGYGWCMPRHLLGSPCDVTLSRMASVLCKKIILVRGLQPPVLSGPMWCLDPSAQHG